MAGFYELVGGLRARVLATSGPEQPIVSGQYLKYSRFWETATGDRFDLHCVVAVDLDGRPHGPERAFGRRLVRHAECPVCRFGSAHRPD
jgi:hypothetical protein